MHVSGTPISLTTHPKPSRPDAPTTGLTLRQLRVVVVLGFCGLVSAVDNWFVSPALPAIANTLAVAPTAAAIILTAYLVPYGALQPVCGRIGDGVGRLRLLRIIVLGLCAGTFLCALAPSLSLLVAARIITGCFAAGIISVSQAFVGDVVGPKYRAGAVGILMGITFTGQGLSAGLGGILTDLVGWRAAFAAFGMLAALAWLGLFTLRDAGRPPAQDTIRSSAQAGKRPPYENPVSSFLRDAWRIFFGPHRAVFLLACSTGFLFLGTYGLMGTFLSEVCGLASTQAGLVMMLYGFFCLIGGALAGRLGGARGLSGVISVGERAGMVSAATLALSCVTGSWIPSLVAAASLGMGYILVQPTLVTLSMDADPAQSGLCTGLIGFAVFACGGVGSAVGTAIVSHGGYALLWVLVLLCLGLQALISRRVLR